jgi:hypothetical protein
LCYKRAKLLIEIHLQDASGLLHWRLSVKNTDNAAIEVGGDLYENNFIDKVIAYLQFCTLHIT